MPASKSSQRRSQAFLDRLKKDEQDWIWSQLDKAKKQCLCPYCGAFFSRGIGLDSHIQRVHFRERRKGDKA